MRAQTYRAVFSGYSSPSSLLEACAQPARSAAAAVRRQLREYRRRVRTRHELMTLSESDLRDIFRTRAEVEAEARKPFWRA